MPTPESESPLTRPYNVDWLRFIQPPNATASITPLQQEFWRWAIPQVDQKLFDQVDADKTSFARRTVDADETERQKDSIFFACQEMLTKDPDGIILLPLYGTAQMYQRLLDANQGYPERTGRIYPFVASRSTGVILNQGVIFHTPIPRALIKNPGVLKLFNDDLIDKAGLLEAIVGARLKDLDNFLETMHRKNIVPAVIFSKNSPFIEALRNKAQLLYDAWGQQVLALLEGVIPRDGEWLTGAGCDTSISIELLLQQEAMVELLQDPRYQGCTQGLDGWKLRIGGSQEGAIRIEPGGYNHLVAFVADYLAGLIRSQWKVVSKPQN